MNAEEQGNGEEAGTQQSNLFSTSTILVALSKFFQLCLAN
jgi:hypothetical protein